LAEQAQVSLLWFSCWLISILWLLVS